MKYENGIETKKDILKVAKELFFKKGFTNTSIREIAKNANISSGAIYKHFDGKEAILDAIVAPQVDEFWELCNAALIDFENGLEKISSKEEMIALTNTDSSSFLYAKIENNLDTWRFILFKSHDTKYANFFNDFISWETTATLKILDIVSKDKTYKKYISDKEIYLIISGFYSSAIDSFKADLSAEERLNYFRLLSKTYKPIWEDLFLKVFKRKD